MRIVAGVSAQPDITSETRKYKSNRAGSRKTPWWEKPRT